MLTALLVLFGFVGGYIVCYFYFRAQQDVDFKLIVKTAKREIKRAYNYGLKFGAVKPLLSRINDISKEQADYLSALDRPSASAAHSRHKNSIVSSLKKLEEEKVSLFKSIIEQGVDPVLTVSMNGEIKEMKTSELLANMENPSTQEEPIKTETNIPRKENKLRLVADNEESPNVPKPRNPTVH